MGIGSRQRLEELEELKLGGSDLNENGFHSSVCFYSWLPVVRDVWKELVCVAFLEEVCHGWRTFRFQMTPAIVIGPSTYCFHFKR